MCGHSGVTVVSSAVAVLNAAQYLDEMSLDAPIIEIYVWSDKYTNLADVLVIECIHIKKSHCSLYMSLLCWLKQNKNNKAK